MSSVGLPLSQVTEVVCTRTEEFDRKSRGGRVPELGKGEMLMRPLDMFIVNNSQYPSILPDQNGNSSLSKMSCKETKTPLV